MNARRLLPALFAALVVSGLFTWLLSHHFAKPVAAAPAPIHRFAAAVKNLQAGEQIQPAMLTLADWPASQPLKGAFAKPEDLTGRVLLFPIPAGEIVLDNHLAAAGSGTGLTAHIPEGMRAIALRSDEVAGVAGFLLPGTFVDVLVTYAAPVTGNTQNPANNLITSTVLQNVKVLAAGQKLEADPSGKADMASVVTLLVTPRDAEKLTLASSLGKILFVLRNNIDRKDVEDLTPQTSLGGAPTNFDVPAPASVPTATPKPRPVHAPPAASPKPSYSVQVMAGNKLTEQTFEQSKNTDRKEP